MLGLNCCCGYGWLGGCCGYGWCCCCGGGAAGGCCVAVDAVGPTGTGLATCSPPPGPETNIGGGRSVFAYIRRYSLYTFCSRVGLTKGGGPGGGGLCAGSSSPAGNAGGSAGAVAPLARARALAASTRSACFCFIAAHRASASSTEIYAPSPIACTAASTFLARTLARYSTALRRLNAATSLERFAACRSSRPAPFRSCRRCDCIRSCSRRFWATRSLLRPTAASISVRTCFSFACSRSSRPCSRFAARKWTRQLCFSASDTYFPLNPARAQYSFWRACWYSAWYWAK
mmetsp:Transcript_80937/g.142751  ORF Transcript_80937/g.142751 Transcript_80937/m.142751 type:complete len:288 (-) Transcript_80937:482-1345(-)